MASISRLASDIDRAIGGILKDSLVIAITAATLIITQSGPACGSACAKEQVAKSSNTGAAGSAIGILPQRLRKGVHEEIHIDAPPSVVWHCMEQQRTIDPDSTAVKTGCKNGVVNIEQKFSFPCPPFGSAECTLRLAEVTNHRVDFKLLESDDLKAMEGSWVLTGSEDGKASKLELYSYVEPYIMIPRIICNALSSHKAKKNLGAVKKMAEQNVYRLSNNCSETGSSSVLKATR